MMSSDETTARMLSEVLTVMEWSKNKLSSTWRRLTGARKSEKVVNSISLLLEGIKSLDDDSSFKLFNIMKFFNNKNYKEGKIDWKVDLIIPEKCLENHCFSIMVNFNQTAQKSNSPSIHPWCAVVDAAVIRENSISTQHSTMKLNIYWIFLLHLPVYLMCTRRMVERWKGEKPWIFHWIVCTLLCGSTMEWNFSIFMNEKWARRRNMEVGNFRINSSILPTFFDESHLNLDVRHPSQLETFPPPWDVLCERDSTEVGLFVNFIVQDIHFGCAALLGCREEIYRMWFSAHGEEQKED